MKIVIPVDNNSMDTTVCISFGRAPYFLIYETETEEKSFINNSAAASQGGAGIKAAQSIVDSGAEAIITPRCGENAAEVIKAAGIIMYRTINNSIQDNLQALKEGRLTLLDEIHAGFHQRGGNS
ncbi:NifB/NifX family molybdenum-iron cluster-binding protein [Dehalobacter sp. DCM]|uniref:NifB/NifX family molybdenum-iron cluster-binding protein n=1 Tax=Dehalobacter sp. DCM TaxID=2907827 RepID=UPI003081A7D5|nr:NifB/NifX family molybdenum-iron cluster-binding protein [Dehalobacter sp. DCM]